MKLLIIFGSIHYDTKETIAVIKMDYDWNANKGFI